MLNSLDAGTGKDFDYIQHKDQKNKLNPAIIAFWEVVEAENMDIFKADGHHLGRTFKFRINVSENAEYKDFFQNLLREPLYNDYTINVKEEIPGKELLVVFERSNLDTVFRKNY